MMTSSTSVECNPPEGTKYPYCSSSYVRVDFCMLCTLYIQESLLHPNTAASGIYPSAFNQYTYPKAHDRPTPVPRKLSSRLPSSPDTSSSYLSIPPGLSSYPYLFGVPHYYQTSSPSHASRSVLDPFGTSSPTSTLRLRTLQYATD